MNPRAIPAAVLAVLFATACGGEKTTPSTPAAGSPPAAGAGQPSKEASAQAPAGEQGATQGANAPAKKPTPPVRIDMVTVKAFFGSEPFSPPVDNPSTPEKVALGKMLFHETSLSKDGKVSCASCHDLGNYGQDGKVTSTGAEGKASKRNAPTVYNAARQYMQFWDGRAANVEEQALVHALETTTFGLADEAELVAKLKAKPAIVEAFGKAFAGDADAVNAGNFKLAIGAFERTLVTKSKFEEFVAGDARALSNEEKLGLKTFMDVGCTQCHMSRLVGGGMIQKLGVHKPYPGQDTGRMQVTGSESDKAMFKVSSLLNVAKTAPYHHDGKSATLAEAVASMAAMQLGKTLKEEEVSSIVTFLNALTGTLPAESSK